MTAATTKELTAAPAPSGLAIKSDPRAMQFKHLLEGGSMQKAIKAALPKHISLERFVRVVIGVIGQSKDLLNCTPESVLVSLMRAASMGLEPDGGPLGQGYLVPFGRECQFIPGYRGLIKLARNSGEVADVWAEVVYAADTFEYDLGLEPSLKHRRNDDVADAGALKYAYSVARFRDGEKRFVVLNRREVEKIKAVSKSAKSEYSPWKTWESEMWKKTAVRRLCKLLPLSVDVQRQVERDTDDGADSSVLADIDLMPAIDVATTAAIEQASAPVAEREPGAEG